MTVESYRNVIRNRFEQNVVLNITPNPICIYDNSPVKPPTTDVFWMRLAILPTVSQQIEFGVSSARRYRTSGLMVAQLFDTIESGDRNILEVVDLINTHFRGVTDTLVKFKVPTESTIGRDGKWWQVNVSCPWFIDEFA